MRSIGKDKNQRRWKKKRIKKKKTDTNGITERPTKKKKNRMRSIRKDKNQRRWKKKKELKKKLRQIVWQRYKNQRKIRKDANWQRTKLVCTLHMGIFVCSNYEYFPPSFLPILVGLSRKHPNPTFFFFSSLQPNTHQ